MIIMINDNDKVITCTIGVAAWRVHVGQKRQSGGYDRRGLTPPDLLSPLTHSPTPLILTQPLPSSTSRTRARESQVDAYFVFKCKYQPLASGPAPKFRYTALTPQYQGWEDSPIVPTSIRGVRPFRSVNHLHAYRGFERPVEIAATKGGTIFACVTGSLRVATSASSIERGLDREGAYHAPGVHVRLLSLGRLEGQGCDIRLEGPARSGGG